MEDDDRRQILDNIDRLINVTKFETLLKKCQMKGVLTSNMSDDIKNLEESEAVKHRRLLEKITKRGPEAFDKLLQICNESGYQEAHRILKPTGTYNANGFHSIRDSTTESNPQIQEVDIRLEPYTEQTNPLYTVNVEKSTVINSNRITCYNMYSAKRGVFFFVNNTSIGQTERRTAHMDKDYLISLFRGLGFTIFYYENITLKDLVELIDQLILSKYLKKVDSFVFTILCDGFSFKKKTILQFTDHTERATYFLKKFNNQHCTNLINTPKIFIFPMCRQRYGYENPLPSNETDITLVNGATHRSARDGVNLDYNPPTYSDILYFYIDLDNTNSFTNYIDVMCNVWANYARNTHLEHLIKLVKLETFLAGDLTEDRDTHNFGFNFMLYFNPGCVSNF